jgi:protein ImuA
MSQISPENCADLSRPAASSQSGSREQLMEGLRRQLSRWQAKDAADEAVFSCGAEAVDRLLPGGGLRHGMLIEWVGAQKNSRAGERQSGRSYYSTALPLCCSSTATLGLLAAREACRGGGVLVVVDRARTFYPPAAAAWGIDLERLIVVHPQNARDELWAAVQALRSPVVAALWASIERLDSRAFRRLQLAAEAGRTLGALVRPAAARGQPTWADVRLEIGPLSVVRCIRTTDHGPRTTDHGRRVQVRIVHCRGGRAGGLATLQIDDVARTVQLSSTHDAHSLPVVTELADSASRSLSARA